MPIAIPIGVVSEKNIAMMAVAKDLYFAWEMHPPSPMPSKNWWNDKAASRDFMVEMFCEAPNERPMITEWTIIPSSNT